MVSVGSWECGNKALRVWEMVMILEREVEDEA